ncbi:LptA/OstA family protein [Aquifex sp.]
MKWKALILLLSFSTLLYAQSSITGESDELIYLENKLIYKGNVRLIRDSSVLRAEKVEIILNEEGKPVKIIASGNVKIIEPERKVFANYAEYDLIKDIIYLKGSAKIQEKTRILEADEITIYRKENRLVAKGGKKRVRTVYLEGKK